jgi:hypothetical protein
VSPSSIVEDLDPPILQAVLEQDHGRTAGLHHPKRLFSTYATVEPECSISLYDIKFMHGPNKQKASDILDKIGRPGYPDLRKFIDGKVLRNKKGKDLDLGY